MHARLPPARACLVCMRACARSWPCMRACARSWPCVHACMRAWMGMRACARMHAGMGVLTCAWMGMHACICPGLWVYACICACLLACVHAYMRACKHACACMHVHMLTKSLFDIARFYRFFKRKVRNKKNWGLLYILFYNYKSITNMFASFFCQKKILHFV
jgi:hypothetical protein